MEKQAFEPTGLIPRSIIRTVDRFVQQLLPGREKIALQEYRVSRYQILVSIKSLLTLILIPLIISSTIKGLLFTPLVEHFWNNSQSEIFLNEYQEKRAFSEMHDFSEKIFFESLLVDPKPKTNRVILAEKNDVALNLQSMPLPLQNKGIKSMICNPTFNEQAHAQRDSTAFLTSPPVYKSSYKSKICTCKEMMTNKSVEFGYQRKQSNDRSWLYHEASAPFLQISDLQDEKQGLILNETLHNQSLFQIKSLELAKSYNKQSILAITNLLGDFLTFFTVTILFKIMRPELIILKSFLTESVYSLSDTTKSFLLILGMDLLVGFHSPRGWELALEGFLRHIGLPENENFILLFVALFPVFLDTVFKYWIFRYLNKISPSTVVTYHSMIE